MNSTVKALWVEALTSGEYRQAAGQLRRGEFFCCYGVLCDLHRKATGAGGWKGDAFQVEDTERRHFSPPVTVSQWAGLLDGRSIVTIGAHWLELARHNDRGRTFAEIAAAIQEQL